MRHGARIVVALVLTLTVSACSPAGDAAPATDASFSDAVLDVRAEGCGPREIYGTASLVGAEHAVTAAHVVAGADVVTVIDADGAASVADVVLFDPELDVALLRTPPELGVPLDFYDDDITAGLGGMVAYARFESGGVDVRTAPVEVVRHVNIETTDIYLTTEVTRSGFEIEASIDPGDSGAVVVIDGRAAGIIWARSTENEGRAWAVDIPGAIRDPAARQALIDPVDTGPCPG
jgi:S1-C subfamily serine protease